MTVCVAAIGEHGQALFLASDRMVSGHAQYQAPDPKIFQLTSSIVVMWAGDVSFQRTILNRLRRDVEIRIAREPERWLEVEEVAALYQHYYNEVRREYMEQSVLEPYGLNTERFLVSQASMEQGLARRLEREMKAFPVPEFGALVVGGDLCGIGGAPAVHIYKVIGYGGEATISCEDSLGFAAIGSGSYQALSEFMRLRHGPSQTAEGSLFAAYMAKKRGQAAPGVGEETDLVFFRPRPPRPSWVQLVDEEILQHLDDEFMQLVEAEQRATAQVQQSLAKMVARRAAASPPTGQASGTDAASLLEKSEVQEQS